MSVGAIGRYFDSRADSWDATMEPSGTKHLMVAQLAGVRSGSRVLDVGCGTGVMERADRALGASEIVALDVSENMIEHARANYADISASQLRFECMDVVEFAKGAGTGIPENRNKQFDTVVIYNAYPHILNKPELAGTVSNLLKDGGRFLVAHGIGYKLLNAHHADVPHDITSDLRSAKEESEIWESEFTIDMMADTPFVYFFGGCKKR